MFRVGLVILSILLKTNHSSHFFTSCSTDCLKLSAWKRCHSFESSIHLKQRSSFYFLTTEHLILRGGEASRSVQRGSKTKPPAMKFVSGGLLNQKPLKKKARSVQATPALPLKSRPHKRRQPYRTQPSQTPQSPSGRVVPSRGPHPDRARAAQPPPPPPSPLGELESESWPEEMYAQYPELLARRRARDSARRLESMLRDGARLLPVLDAAVGLSADPLALGRAIMGTAEAAAAARPELVGLVRECALALCGAAACIVFATTNGPPARPPARCSRSRASAS